MWVVGVNPRGSCQTPPESSRAVLRWGARERDTKAWADPEGTPVQFRNEPRHLVVRNRRPQDGAGRAGILPFRDEGQRACRTAADVREQGVRVGVRSIHARCQSGAHPLGVGQQVVEKPEYRRPAVTGRNQAATRVRPAWRPSRRATPCHIRA